MNKTPVCQSCSMFIDKEDQFGSNQDGTKHHEYCIGCYEKGAFKQDMTLEEFIQYSLQFAKEIGMTKSEMLTYCNETLPTLKRWR